MEASACATFRDIAVSRAIPCSAAATVFAVGALTTRHPNSVAACRSTLSIPTPALPTTFNLPLAASKTCLVTFVPLRTIKASHVEILAQSSSGERLYAHSKLPKPRRTWRPASPSFSETKMVGVESEDVGLRFWDLETEVSDESTVFKTLVMRKEWEWELWAWEWESFKEMGFEEEVWRKERREGFEEDGGWEEAEEEALKGEVVEMALMEEEAMEAGGSVLSFVFLCLCVFWVSVCDWLGVGVRGGLSKRRVS